MENKTTNLCKIMLLDSSVSGKSTLGNKLSGKEIFNVDLGPSSFYGIEREYS